MPPTTLFATNHFPTESSIDKTPFVGFVAILLSVVQGLRTTREVNWQRLAGLFIADTCVSLMWVESMINPTLKWGSIGDRSGQLCDRQCFFACFFCARAVVWPLEVIFNQTGRYQCGRWCSSRGVLLNVRDHCCDG
mmetsp:Transcript_1219/g.3047  ORF Transcript_1219/g.3047 Transcript_1219/m.3047 type:complete len:136 (-) Transcript_1219:162-569(-)